MSLHRYDIACDNCETDSIVLVPPEQEQPPQFCPVCGTSLDQESNEEEDG